MWLSVTCSGTSPFCLINIKFMLNFTYLATLYCLNPTGEKQYSFICEKCKVPPGRAEEVFQVHMKASRVCPPQGTAGRES